MSASTVPITANPAVNNTPSLGLGSRRRNVSVTEKRSSNIEMVNEVSGGVGVSEPANGDGRDLSHSIRGEMVLEKPKDISSSQAKKGLINSTISPRRRKVVTKPPEKPFWQTLLSIFTKNFLLLLVLLGLIQMIRKLALKSGSGDVAVSPKEILTIEGRIAEVESFLKKTTKMMQVQVDMVDKKVENEVGGLRMDLAKVEERGLVIEDEVKKLGVRTDSLDKSLGDLRASGFLTKEDMDRFSAELNKRRSPEGSNKDWSLDEIRAVAREIVEKEIERHAADGLAWVDYALASGGAFVVGHSEPYFSVKGTNWLTKGQKIVNSEARRMLQPSFGEPGECFPLKGSSGFVEIKLRTAIIPEAVTLEHVAKSVAYDRSSAPKDCRISGWFQGHDADPSRQAKKKFLLAEFSYDLERSTAQTFNVDPTDSGIVNMVRLDFTSNHGGPHTCIYRLRVHGRELDSVAISTLQP